MLLIVAYEVAELLLPALQRGVKLLHLVHQVGLLCFQTLPVRLHGCDKAGGGGEEKRAQSFGSQVQLQAVKMFLAFLTCTRKKQQDTNMKSTWDEAIMLVGFSF